MQPFLQIHWKKKQKKTLFSGADASSPAQFCFALLLRSLEGNISVCDEKSSQRRGAVQNMMCTPVSIAYDFLEAYTY